MPAKNRPGKPSRPLKSLSPLGRVLRAIRGDLSCEAAADRLGELADWWNRRENGKIKATVEDVQYVSQIFGVDWVIGPEMVAVYPLGTLRLRKAE